MMNKARSLVPLALLAGAVSSALVGCGGGDDGPEARLRVLSSDASMVTGGDALVSVELPSGLAAQDVSLKLNSTDVSDQLQFDAATNSMRGVVAGLAEGANTLEATTSRGRSTKLSLTNYPGTGGAFGAHQRPWICETDTSGLGAPPASGPCVTQARYDWFYRTTGGNFAMLPNGALPTDLATTTTSDGNKVNFIVRVESGTINESIYRIAILDDPANPIANVWSSTGKKPGAGWNGKMVWTFGGGASPAFRSGRNTLAAGPAAAFLNTVGAVSPDTSLGLGFAVAFGTRNTYGTGSDDVVSAETVMMIKERFIEQYGVPKFTIGAGRSGGAIQQHLISQNYPGLLDAIMPGAPYPDGASIATDVIDCHVLHNYFNNIANPADWPGSRRSKVDGYAVAPTGDFAGTTICQNGWSGLADMWQNAQGPLALRGFDAVVPLSLRYNPVTNRAGARGTIWDSNVLSIGTDPVTGFARSAYDNVGVQYGLKALNRGDITTTEFLDLNEKIGGRDVDGNITTQRSRGDEVGIANAYRHGRVTSGANWTLPTIHLRPYNDFANDIHTKDRSFAVLDRLQRANGTTKNVVMWTTSGALTSAAVERDALLAQNDWLERLQADTSTRSYAEKVIANRPATLKDTCWDPAGVKHEELPTLDPAATCNQIYPIHQNVRLVAGGPISGDILKCQLKPTNPNDYAISFTAPELLRLNAIFPQGVCDWSKSGVGQQPMVSSWLRYPAPGQAIAISKGQ